MAARYVQNQGPGSYNGCHVAVKRWASGEVRKLVSGTDGKGCVLDLDRMLADHPDRFRVTNATQYSRWRKRAGL